MNSISNEQRVFAKKLINDVFYEAELNQFGHGCYIVPSARTVLHPQNLASPSYFIPLRRSSRSNSLSSATCGN